MKLAEKLIEPALGRRHSGELEGIAEEDQFGVLPRDALAQGCKGGALTFVAEQVRFAALVEMQVAEDVQCHA